MAANNDAIEDLWDRIHEWMNKHAPQMLNLLNPGATPADMMNMVHNLNLNDLPEDFKASYRIHNGSRAREFFGSPMINSFRHTEDIEVCWSLNKAAHAHANNLHYERNHNDPVEIQTVLWSDRWIPFGGDEDHNAICIDLEPTDSGKYGQVIQWFNNDLNSPVLRASSFTEFLTAFTNDLENAKYSLSDDCQKLIFTEVDNK